MSFDVTLPLITRNLIGDVDTTNQTYSDDRLIELCLVAAQLLKFDISLPTTYAIDLDNLTLSPDPTVSPQDDTFITMCCLKASLILLRGETNKSTAQAIQVRDGLSLVDLRSVTSSKLLLLKTLQADYDQAKMLYLTTGSTGSIGRMICSPFRLASAENLVYPGYYGNHRHY